MKLNCNEHRAAGLQIPHEIEVVKPQRTRATKKRTKIMKIKDNYKIKRNG